jgi:exopolyphosphatase
MVCKLVNRLLEAGPDAYQQLENLITLPDLDSLCSAVVYAYLRTYSPLSKSKIIHVPLSNLLRTDLQLRPELRSVLSKAHLELDDLLTLSDLQPFAQNSTIDPLNTRWILVDHNALQGELGQVYSSRVYGVVDHHDEENKVPKDCLDEPRIIKGSGSCASLVVEYCREAWDALSSTLPLIVTTTWDTELAHLAMAPILIDTTNLTYASKVTSHDTSAVSYLESKINRSSAPFSRDSYFAEISSAKEDIGGLPLTDILRKDYKQWTEPFSTILGISSTVKPLSFLLSKAGSKDLLLDTIHNFAMDRNLAIYALMTTSTIESGTFRRELLVIALAGAEKGRLAMQAFSHNAREELGLAEWASVQGGGVGDGGKGFDHETGTSGKERWVWCWDQRNLGASRKQVGPLLRKAIKETAES